jgi:hypothetical protein
MNVIRETIPLVNLSARVTELRDSKREYNKFLVEIFEGNKRFVQLRAWHYKKGDRK